MRLFTSDETMSVDVGTGSIWYSIYSTAEVAFSEDVKKGIQLALAFLKTGECPAESITETRKQLVVVRKAFSDIAPENAVYDLHKPDVAPPWFGNIAATATSCTNLYTTADGKDLFTEILALLEYAGGNKLSICAG